MTVCAELHFNIRKEIVVELDNEHWNNHVPKLLETGHVGKAIILWNKQGQTDGNVRKLKPDIVFCDNEKRTCMTIDVAVKCYQERSRENSII
jgi:hypothetical protein